MFPPGRFFRMTTTFAATRVGSTLLPSEVLCPLLAAAMDEESAYRFAPHPLVSLPRTAERRPIDKGLSRAVPSNKDREE
jgi:hypothetical protein